MKTNPTFAAGGSGVGFLHSTAVSLQLNKLTQKESNFNEINLCFIEKITLDCIQDNIPGYKDFHEMKKENFFQKITKVNNKGRP